jgi:soluble lytic murein transglycosylase
MLNQPKKRVALMIGLGVSALLLGAGLPLVTVSGLLGKSGESAPVAPDAPATRQITALKSLAPDERLTRLKALAQKPESPDSSRARYLLATELLQQGQAQKAVEQLQALETAAPALAAHSVMKRAQAHERAGDQTKAKETWQELLQRYPQSPVSAEALAALGKEDEKYHDRAIAEFPSHPRTVEIAQQQLQKNPKQPELLRLVARHGLYLRDYVNALDLLTTEYSARLTPEDWESVGFGYWEKQEYGKAGTAYSRAPNTPRNLYRTARGLQLGGKPGATQAYLQLVRTFPDTPEAGQGLLRLAQVAEQPQDALVYLDQAIERFPDRAGEALLEKAKLLEKLDSAQSAAETRKTLLSRHGKSDAAAELRWTLAQERAAAQDFENAWRWAEPIPTQNPDSEVAPQAAFWVGKWATQLNKQAEAKAAFEFVLSRYPESYYAWRSASLLGWDVGDFNSVRQLNPTVVRPEARSELPAGSDTLKELHKLGQDQDAWTLWQAEFKNPDQPSVAEQFTDGVMRVGVGDFLDGIFMVSFLSEREKPEEQAQYRDLKRQPVYWQALYPFPFLEPIEQWSRDRQLNPLLVTALIRQESRFMTGIQSSVGATGLMQVMPDTAAWIAKQIKLKQYQLNEPNDNIKLGTWFLDYTHREYDNNSMFAVASYNAGPNAVADWVQKKPGMDLDRFVEEIPYDETRGYVKHVFENYWNYLRLYNPEISQKLAQVSKEHPVDAGM